MSAQRRGPLVIIVGVLSAFTLAASADPRRVSPPSPAPASGSASTLAASADPRRGLPPPPVPVASSSASAPRGSPPDPAPLRTKKKWRYEIVYDRGGLFSGTPTSVTLPKPTETSRVMGRFAVELWVGTTLLERARFDVPLLVADDDPGRPRFDDKLRAKVSVEVPDTDRATAAVLVDRATGRRMRLFWPPVDAAPAASAP